MQAGRCNDADDRELQGSGTDDRIVADHRGTFCLTRARASQRVGGRCLPGPPGGVIRQGETLSAAFFLHPAEEPMTGRRWVDAYVVAQIPGGGWYAYAPPRAWAPFGLGRGAPPPPAAVYGLDVHREIQGMAFTMEMERDLPTGEYAVYSILAPRGSDPRRGGPDLRVAKFTLGEAP